MFWSAYQLRQVKYRSEYTYDANGNKNKEEYDSGNDGTIDYVHYYTWELLWKLFHSEV
jgi:hypothetical protein